MMKHGTMYKQRELLLIPIPFSNLESRKKRPVIVISNDAYNRKTRDILIAAVTSNIEQKDYTVPITQTSMAEGKLLRDSIIRVDKVYSLSQEIVIKKLGRIKIEVFNRIVAVLNKLLSPV